MAWIEPSDESEWDESSANTFTVDSGVWVLFPICLEAAATISKYRIKLAETCGSEEVKIALYNVSASSFFPTTLIHGGTAQPATAGMIEETLPSPQTYDPDDLNDPTDPRLWIGLRASGGESCLDNALSYASGGSTPLPWGFMARRVGITGGEAFFGDDWPADITGDTDANVTIGYAAVFDTAGNGNGGGGAPCTNHVIFYYGIETPLVRGELPFCGVNPGALAVSAGGVAIVGGNIVLDGEGLESSVVYADFPYDDTDFIDMSGIVPLNTGVSSIKII